jgi:hypothetical protein
VRRAGWPWSSFVYVTGAAVASRISYVLIYESYVTMLRRYVDPTLLYLCNDQEGLFEWVGVTAGRLGRNTQWS